MPLSIEPKTVKSQTRSFLLKASPEFAAASPNIENVGGVDETCYFCGNVTRPKQAGSIHQLRFVTSAVDLQGCPNDDFPEVAMVGRSNSGKSTLINGMAGARIALVSSTPGKTRMLNFYQAPRYRLVDMPGYGFSVRSGDEENAWAQMIEPYLSQRDYLIGLLIVMDIRRDWSDEEENLLRWISPRGLPSALILTKSDKLSRSEMTKRQNKLRKDSGLEHVFVTSSLKKQGFPEIEDFIYQQWISGPEELN